jgi:hypothetical protein
LIANQICSASSREPSAENECSNCPLL